MRLSWIGLIAAAVLATAGCATRSPPRAAMVPLTQTGEFGYSDNKLADDRYEVTYVGARIRTPARGDARSAKIEAEKQRVHDFALWHAAQLALQNGFPAFKVEQESRDADVAVHTEPVGAPYPFVFPPYYGYPYRYGPYGAYPYDDYYYRSYASARVRAKLKIHMLKQPTEGSLDAKSTAERLSQAYAGAGYS